MSERAISDAWFSRIKAATRDLVKACGGLERAGEIARVGKSTVGRWQHIGEEDIIPITAVLALEGDCDRPYVTRIMADLNGRGLTDPAAEAALTGCIDTQHGEVLSAAAQFTTEFVMAKRDGIISPTEAEVMDRAAATVIRTAEDMRTSLASLKAGAPRLVRGA